MNHVFNVTISEINSISFSDNLQYMYLSAVTTDGLHVAVKMPMQRYEVTKDDGYYTVKIKENG